MRFSSTIFMALLAIFALTPLGKTINQLSEQTGEQTGQLKQECHPSPYNPDNPYDPFRDDVFINELEKLRFNLSLFSLAEKDKDIGSKIRPFTQTIVNSSVFALSNFMNWRAIYLQSCDTKEVLYSAKMERANGLFLELFQGVFGSEELQPFSEKWIKDYGAFLCGHGSLCVGRDGATVIRGRAVKLLKKQGKYVNKDNEQRNFMIVISRLLLSETKSIKNPSNQVFKPAPKLALSSFGTTLANIRLKTLHEWWEKLPLTDKLAALSAYYLPRN